MIVSLEKKIDDLYAWQLLSPLVVGYPYLPFTGAAARPIVLAHVLNEIVVNRRRSVIEFGSGISTILMARLIQRNRLDAKVVSIEHDANWVDAMRGLLAAEDIGDAVEIVHAPLAPCDHALEGNHWYDLSVLASRIAEKRFDLALVDGPPAWETGKGMTRYPAGPFLEDRMAERCALFLDDADRLGERLVMGKWNATGAWKLKVIHQSFAFATRGDAFYADPFVYHQ